MTGDGPFAADLRRARACWVGSEVVAWRPSAPWEPRFGGEVFLAWDEEGSLGARIAAGEANTLPLTLDPRGLAPEQRAKFPHLAELPAFRLPPTRRDEVAAALRAQAGVFVREARGPIVEGTSLQHQGVLDELYTYRGPLGVSFDDRRSPTFRLWAPTARSVRLLLFAAAEGGEATPVSLRRDGASGMWSAEGEPSWYGRYYLYEVEVFVRTTGRFETNRVTDPYSVSLSRNSRRSQTIDLRDPALCPEGWDALAKPPLARFSDVVLYELHVRDFSASDPTVPEPWRGTYKAFTLPDSTGVRHLRTLAATGISHLHLLPISDFATVEEERSKWREPDLAGLPPDSDEQQARLASLGTSDPFNWGYDPLHYLVPEGSYATDPEGPTRIREVREMIAALAAAGLRTVMDVVLNHTFASGQDEHSVLDRVVPGYYHRLNAEGEVETSTVCANTASEFAMVERLMVDAVVTWAREYKVDGFRFDLMGHHMKRNLLVVRSALDALTLERDGVDGRTLYLYGEGWSFGEVANGARGEQAIQATLAGTGIGTFNDRLRDAVRGGGAFGGLCEQGFATGLYVAPNETARGTEADRLARLQAAADAIRASLSGGLAAFVHRDRFGRSLPASALDWNGQPAGYTGLPWESVSYVESHDNETLFDCVQLKAPRAATLADRVRMHNLAVSLVALGQGVPFFHAGVELLRSKSGDRNSYHSGDWFNRLDFTLRTSNWGVGLPPARDNRDRWEVLRPLLADPALQPGPPEIAAAYHHFLEMLAIRRSTPLFRLPSAEDVRRRLRFFNTGPEQIPGLIGLWIDDPGGEIDREHDRVAVLFNAAEETRILAVPELEGSALALHPVLQESHDPVARAASFHPGLAVFSIPGRTTAVFWSER
jgi:pullulanase-type alpha-1,6-glucosidase